MENNKLLINRGVRALKIEINNYDQKSRFVEYKVSGVPICEYDQHSRARIGVQFFNYQVNEQPIYHFYTNLYDKMISNKEFMAKILETLEELETIKHNQTLYNNNLMSRDCSYEVRQSFDSLRGQMSRRLKFCEEEFIVGVHNQLRYQLIEMGCEEAKNWLPDCDRVKKCTYISDTDYLSNMFGCLFSSCGRWPAKQSDYHSFNHSCTSREELEKQLGTNTIVPSSSFELNS